MHGQTMQDQELHDRPQDCPPEKLLSLILAQFSQLLALLHRLHILKIRQEDFLHHQALTDLQQQLNAGCFGQKMLSSSVAAISEKVPHSAVILKRFRCRLVQIILPCKQRLSDSSRGNTLSQTLHRVEREIYRFEDGLFLKEFLINLLGIFSTHLQFERQSKDKGVDNPQKIQLSKEIIHLSKNNASAVRSKTFYEESGHHKKMRKVMTDLNSQFKTMDCLDLNYSSYKSTFFQAKNQQDDMYQECLERNRTISALIKTYSKDFREYLKRKEKRKFQRRLNLITLEREVVRNNVASKPSNSYINFSHHSPVSKKSSLNPFYSRKGHNEEHLSPVTPNTSKRFSFIEKRGEVDKELESPKKTQLHMKKIIITSSKFKMVSQELSPMKRISNGGTKDGGRKSLKNQKKLLINNLPELCFRNKY